MLFYCPACDQDKPKSAFHSDRNDKTGRSTYCRICACAKKLKKREENREADRATQRRFREKHRERLRLKRRVHYYANQKAEQKKARDWSRAHPEVAKSRHRQVKLQALAIVSPDIKCAYCGERDPMKLEIDHVMGDGREHRKTFSNLHYHLVRDGIPADTKLQILCEKHNGMKCWLTEEEFREEVKKLALIFST